MDNIAINMVLDSKNNSVNHEANKDMAKTVSNNQNTSNNLVNHVKPQDLVLSIRKNVESKATEILSDEDVKFSHLNKKICFLYQGLIDPEMLGLFYRAYHGNENSFMKNSSVPVQLPLTYCNPLNIFGAVQSNVSQSEFKRIPWKLNVVTFFKYIKKLLFCKQKSSLNNNMEAVKSKIPKFGAGKKHKSKFSNDPTDCTDEFIYICSEPKSQFMSAPASSNTSQLQ